MAEARLLAPANKMLSSGTNKNSNNLEHSHENKMEIQKILETAAAAFQTKSYKIAAKYFKNALDFCNKRDKIIDKRTLVLIKYMLCTCWLENSEMQELFDALKILEDLEKCYGSLFPMLYYAIGRVYFQLYSFSKADEIVKKGFAALRSDDVKFVACSIPGTNELIPESSRIGLLSSLSSLNDQCSSWRRPDAVCCLAECSTIGHKEGVDKNIFFGSPTFSGMVQVTCNNPSNCCVMNFHIACWKAQKEMEYSLTKLSDKEILHSECFTPNCVDDTGRRCTIKKIEIFDHEATVKATIEPRGDDAMRHIKSVQPSKIATKKTQHRQTKLKIPSGIRTPPAKITRPFKNNNDIKDVPKVDATEDEEDPHAEHTRNANIERLKDLRSRNFGMNGDKIWRPNLSMYGNEYMIATAGVLPDPDFSNDSPDDEEKSFIFSFFYSLISNNGPMKLEHLEEKWKETQEDLIGKNCDSILQHYVDIAAFLTQSLKFAIVGNYICTADKLPEAHDLTKNDACEILKFFMDNDIDQNSTASSLDDEAVFNDIINQDMNSISLSFLKDDKNLADDLNRISEVEMNGFENQRNNCELKSDENECVMLETNEKLSASELRTNAHSFDMPERKITSTTNKQQEIRQVDSKSAVNKNVQKRSSPPEISRNNDCTEWTKNNAAKIQQESLDDQIVHTERDSTTMPKIYGIHSVNNIEYQLALDYSKLKNDKFSRKVKSANDLVDQLHLDDIRDVSIDNTNQPNDGVAKENELLASPMEEKSNSTLTAFNASDYPKQISDKDEMISELKTEVEKLNAALARSREETEQLKFKLAVSQETAAASKRQMLRKILAEQYKYNQSVISAKLNEFCCDYALLATTQQILMTSVGQLLPVNGTDLTNIIAEIKQISINHEAQFMKLDEQLSSNMGVPDEINFQCEEIDGFPRCNMIEVIQLAFDMFKMHQAKELRNMQSSHGKTLFPYPSYDPYRAYPPNSPNNIPGPQACYLSPIPRRLPMNAVNRQPASKPPLLPTPRSSFPANYGSPNTMQHRLHVPNIQAHFMNYPPAPRVNNFQWNQTNAFADLQPKSSSTQATQNSFSTPDQSCVKSSEQTNTFNVQQTTPTGDTGKELDTTLRQLDDLSKKFNVSKTVTAESSIEPPSYESSEQKELVQSNAQSTVVNHDNLPIKNVVSVATKSSENKSHHEITSKNIIMTNEALDNAASNHRIENEPQKIGDHMIDRLIRRLRSHYVGVFELDLLKSIHCVRKQHNNSLSTLSMRRIICEADKFIGASQQKQLCAYAKCQSNASYVVIPSLPCPSDGERKLPISLSSSSSTSSVFSSKKKSGGSTGTKKQWDPVTVPNDTWIKDTEETECVICFDTMVHAECYTLNCKHSFHKKCISDWYKHQTDSKWVMGSCPLCRLHSKIDDEYPPLPLG